MKEVDQFPSSMAEGEKIIAGSRPPNSQERYDPGMVFRADKTTH